ncbi:MAG: efflux RND transporter periplasmic adaptor subunit [Candidatus Vogelbacteria bacterium]|nr:efflux RND transporter periplasmic adaptor subunit [Candidatus Vogelbacteria bacterium]
MFKKFTSQKRLIIVGAIVLVLILAWRFWPRAGNGAEAAVVSRGTLVQTVQTTGKTKPAHNAELSFDRTGRIAFAPVRVGQRVVPGEVLAALDSSDLSSDLASAEAAVLAAKAELAALKRGGRSEEVNLAQLKFTNAEDSLRQALHSAFVQADDAVRNNTDQFFNYPSSLAAEMKYFNGNINDTESTSRIRRELEVALINWKILDDSLSTKSDWSVVYPRVDKYLSQVRDFLNMMSRAVNSFRPDIYYTTVDIAGFRADLASARAQINSATSAVLTAYQALSTARDELSLKKAPGTSEDLAVSEARVAEAEARAQSLRAQIGKNTITSPIYGVVTRQDAEMGETATAGTNLITVMSDGSFEVEAEVAEADIGKIKIGDPVNMSIDAYSDKDWTGRVIYIEPAETVVGGVVNYKIKVAFEVSASDLKSGLTTNLSIETARKENVLFLPSYLITQDGGSYFADKDLGNKKSERVAVTIGIRTPDGKTEILGGLKEGDRVLVAK